MGAHWSWVPPMVAAERVILRARPKSANLVCICPCDPGEEPESGCI